MLLKTGFKYAGVIDNPSIFLDYDKTKGALCGKTGNSLHLYANIQNGTITKIRYVCTCDPTINVVIEALCSIVEGKSITAIRTINEKIIAQLVGSQSKDFLKRVRLISGILKRGITDFERNVIN
jgi:NifU-like protein involved in Fe-S cluster formation